MKQCSTGHNGTMIHHLWAKPRLQCPFRQHSLCNAIQSAIVVMQLTYPIARKHQFSSALRAEPRKRQDNMRWYEDCHRAYRDTSQFAVCTRRWCCPVCEHQEPEQHQQTTTKHTEHHRKRNTKNQGRNSWRNLPVGTCGAAVSPQNAEQQRASLCKR